MRLLRQQHQFSVRHLALDNRHGCFDEVEALLGPPVVAGEQHKRLIGMQTELAARFDSIDRNERVQINPTRNYPSVVVPQCPANFLANMDDFIEQWGHDLTDRCLPGRMAEYFSSVVSENNPVTPLRARDNACKNVVCMDQIV